MRTHNQVFFLLVASILGLVMKTSAFMPMVAKRTTTSRLFETNQGDAVDKKLFEIAQSLKLDVFDLDEGIYGFASKNAKYGLEVVRVEVKTDPSMGISLTEMASGQDGRGLVLVSGVDGNAAQTEMQVGDVICVVRAGKFVGRTTGLNFDQTMETLVQARDEETGHVTLELNRLVKRARITVEVDNGDSVQKIDALAGENLRRLLLRKGIKLYDRNTKRFDMPYATGDCAGEGLCGTCLVAVQQGMESLGPKDNLETLITRDRPLAWRASCRAVVGFDNKDANIRIAVSPQSRFKDELNPGVKSVNSNDL